MLSTAAEGLYWLSRYLERAEFTARLLSNQFEALEDKTVQEIDESWKRIYKALRQKPLLGFESNLGDELFMLTDSFTLTDELTFEENNVNSIRNCISAARENARIVRNLIGSELWTRLNAIHLDLKAIEINTIWNNQPTKFFLEIEDNLRTIAGITQSTMYRDHGWHFSQMGRYVERLQLISALISAQVLFLFEEKSSEESPWLSILKICEARVAYFRIHSLNYPTDLIVEFLVKDVLLPNSIRHSLRQIQESLAEVSKGHFSEHSQQAFTRVGSLIEQVDDFTCSSFESLDQVFKFMERILSSSYHMHDEIRAAFFHYDVESALSDNV